MSKVQKLTFSSLMAALAVVIMLAAYFPYLTIAVPAIAGLAVMLVFYEAGAAYALAAYAVGGALAVLLCEKEAAALFICLFGFYPVLKAYFEKIKSRVVEWILKILFVNAAALLSYYAATALFGIAVEDTDFLGKYGLVLLIAMYNVAFVIYDFCLSSLANEYAKKYRARLAKAFKFLKK